MEGCVKPFTENKSIINEICNKFGTPKKASDEEVLHKGKTYIFKIKESINFHDTYFSGKATGKSTIGRLDVLTRVIPKAHHEYDTIKSKSSSDLFLEITPLTFPIIVKEGTGMSQLRVFAGHPGISELPEQGYFYLEDHIFDEHGNAIHNRKYDELTLNLKPAKISGRVSKGVAFRAKTKEGEDTREAIDLTRKYKKDDDTNKYGPEEYWEIKEPSRKEDENYLEIDTEEFYILRSKERFSLPDDIAVYCRAITEELGEIRIHYAGFVHPAFGSSKKRDDEGLNGAPLAFEVRGHNVKAILRDGETLARLKYYRMSQVGDPEDSADYGDQELKLSKVFKDWPE